MIETRNHIDTRRQLFYLVILANMAEVLSLPQQPDSRSHFGAPIRRSVSNTNILLQSTPSYSGSSPDLKSKYSHVDYDTRHSSSLPSSAPSSPRLAQPDFSNQPSYLSTPSSSLSLDEQCSSDNDDNDDHISFPSYDDEDDSNTSDRGRATMRQAESKLPSSPFEPAIPEIPLNTPAADPPLKEPPQPTLPEISTAGDDTAVSIEPTRHVDYLSHNWKEEDIWSSWKHVVSKRNVYSNSQRLENASWRTWTKSMHRLKTVSPERLNWYESPYARHLSICH